MFFPSKMTKIRVYSIVTLKDSLVDFLHKQGVVHLEKVNLPLERFSGFEWYKEVSSLAVKIRGIIALLNISPKKKFIKRLEPVDSVIKKANNLLKSFGNIERDAKELKDIIEKKNELLKDYLLLKKYSSLYKDRVPKSIELSAIEGKPEEISELLKAITRLKSVVSIEKKISKKHTTLLVASSKSLMPVVSRYNVKYFEFPKEGIENKMNDIKSQIVEIEKKEKRLKGSLEKIKERYGNVLVYLLRQLEAYTDRVEAAENFKSSKRFFVFEGWIPKNKLDTFTSSLKKKFGEGVHIEVINTHEVPPTLLENPKEIKPFERIVDMISLPKGNQIDPTFFFSLTIPLLYGMIIGDVFYSLMAMGFAYWLGRKFNKSKMAQMASKVWMLSSIAGIVWGVVFDEWFGVSHYYWLSKLSEFGIGNIDHAIYQGFSRVHFIPLLMLASIIIGALHLIAGFLIGAYSELRHNKKHAIGKIGFAFFLFDLLLLIPTLAGFLTLNTTILYAFLALSVVMVFYGEGVIGLMELPTVIGNTMSYIRIAAVGLVGVILAELINEFFAPTPAVGFLNLILFVVLISLHFFNAVIAMFEGIIQGGRLNLVEFGTKVYKGGGKKYKPFNLMQKYL